MTFSSPVTDRMDRVLIRHFVNLALIGQQSSWSLRGGLSCWILSPRSAGPFCGQPGSSLDHGFEQLSEGWWMPVLMCMPSVGQRSGNVGRHHTLQSTMDQPRAHFLVHDKSSTGYNGEIWNDTIINRLEGVSLQWPVSLRARHEVGDKCWTVRCHGFREETAAFVALAVRIALSQQPSPLLLRFM